MPLGHLFLSLIHSLPAVEGRYVKNQKRHFSLPGSTLGHTLRTEEEKLAYCTFPPSTHQPQPINFDLVNLAKSSERSISSQLGQDLVLVLIFQAIGVYNQYYVEFGARRPEILNSTHFRNNCGWAGCLFDADPGNWGKKHDLKLPYKNIELIKKEHITSENINEVFQKHKVPLKFDLLTVDIDRNDYWVMEALNEKKFSPRVVCIEYSSYWKLDEPYVIRNNPEKFWDGKSITGASLGAIDKMMRKKGFSFVTEIGGNHAIYVQKKCLHPNDQEIKILPVYAGWQYHLRKKRHFIDKKDWVAIA